MASLRYWARIYSFLSATIGSTRDARRAGRKAAMVATEINNSAAVPMVAGSAAFMPKSNPEI